MKKILAITLLGFSCLVDAQTVQTTPNLITSGTTHTWTGVTTGTLPSNYMPGGPTPIYDPSTNAVTFSYNANATVAQTIAINNALANAGAGVKINGYNYSYDIRNMNGDNRQGGTDTLNVYQSLIGTNGTTLLSSQQTYNTKFEWQSVSGSQTANNPIAMADAARLTFKMVGGDNGYWAGYFGPSVRNVNMSLNYTVDPCATNPAYSPTCANYNTVNFSNNLVPNPTAYAAYGTSIDQSYAINQALQQSGSGVMIHGFQWGYVANANGSYCTSWDIFGCWGTVVTPSVSTNVSITDANGSSIYSVNRTYTNSYNTTSYQYLFPSSRNLATLGRFNFTATTNDSAYVGDMWSKAVYTPDPCTVNPLSSTSCQGYAQAYFDQQCTANPLYNANCPGYAVAYFNQQCSANALYNPSCPGYASAYLSYQCSINPLYSTTCAGYETAYFNQQCSINPLYNSRCQGYDQAYFTQQCNLNGLYDKTCPNYAEAYAKKMLLEQQGIAGTVATAGVVAQTASQTTATVSSDGTITTTSTTGNTTVDKALPPPATTANSAAAPAAPVQLTPPPNNGQQPQAPRDERRAEGGPQGGQPPQGQGPQGSEKPQPTNRQQLAERRMETARKDAVEKGKNLANEMGKAADMESQKQIQNVVIQAMGYTPGFDNYGKTYIPDALGYKMFSIYGGQTTVDNKRLGRGLFGPSDKLHNDMVGQQYNE